MKPFIQQIVLIISISTLLILNGCGTRTSENDLKMKINIGLQNEFKKLGDDIEILEINKINGIEKNLEGIKSYIIIFQAKFKVIRANKVDYQQFSINSTFPASDFIYEIKKGGANFIRTDNGWEFQTVEFDMLSLFEQETQRKNQQEKENSSTNNSPITKKEDGLFLLVDNIDTSSLNIHFINSVTFTFRLKVNNETCSFFISGKSKLRNDSSAIYNGNGRKLKFLFFENEVRITDKGTSIGYYETCSSEGKYIKIIKE